MKKFIYTFILLAGIQFMYGQNFNLQQSEVDITTDNLIKAQKAKGNLNVLLPYGIMTEDCSGATYFTIIDSITPNNDTIRIPVTSTEFASIFGTFLEYGSININGTVDSVVAILQSYGGSLVGNCVAIILEKDEDNTYNALATSDPVSLSSMTTVTTKFTFSNKVTISNDLFVAFSVISADPKDAVLLYTTNACTGSSMAAIAGGSFVFYETLFNFKAEGHIYVYGKFTYDTDVNINDISSINEISIYPNPVSDQLKINNLVEATNINVYSITGQLVKTVSAATGSVDIDVTNLSNGIYIVKMQSGKDTRTEKIQVVR